MVKQDSTDLLAAAQREVDVSRQRLRDTHEKVVKPLRAAAAENSFAELIRRSLIEGRDRGET